MGSTCSPLEQGPGAGVVRGWVHVRALHYRRQLGQAILGASGAPGANRAPRGALPRQPQAAEGRVVQVEPGLNPGSPRLVSTY